MPNIIIQHCDNVIVCDESRLIKIVRFFLLEILYLAMQKISVSIQFNSFLILPNLRTEKYLDLTDVRVSSSYGEPMSCALPNHGVPGSNAWRVADTARYDTKRKT